MACANTLEPKDLGRIDDARELPEHPEAPPELCVEATLSLLARIWLNQIANQATGEISREIGHVGEHLFGEGAEFLGLSSLGYRDPGQSIDDVRESPTGDRFAIEIKTTTQSSETNPGPQRGKALRQLSDAAIRRKLNDMVAKGGEPGELARDLLDSGTRRIYVSVHLDVAENKANLKGYLVGGDEKLLPEPVFDAEVCSEPDPLYDIFDP